MINLHPNDIFMGFSFGTLVTVTIYTFCDYLGTKKSIKQWEELNKLMDDNDKKAREKYNERMKNFRALRDHHNLTDIKVEGETYPLRRVTDKETKTMIDNVLDHNRRNRNGY